MFERERLHIAYRAVLLAFALVVAALLFRQLATLLLAILATVLLAIPLSAVASRLQRLGVPRGVGALLGLLVGVGVIAAIVALLVPPLVEETSTFVDQVPGIVDELQGGLRDLFNTQPGEIGDRVQRYLEGFADEPGRLLGPVASLGISVAGVLGALVVIVLTAFYIAANPDPLVGGMLSLLPPDRREWGRHVMRRLRASWIGWMQGVLVDMVVTGVLLYVGLSLLGLHFALVFAILSALLVLVPYFGAIVGAIPPVLFALTDSPGTAVAALAIYIAVQQIESNVTIPLVMAQRVNLHPAVVAIGVVLVGQLFGIVGLFVAVPILSLGVILTEELWVKPLAERRGVRPVESGAVPEGASALLPAEETTSRT
jgi:predicted PurR-regulated permease PerM